MIINIRTCFATIHTYTNNICIAKNCSTSKQSNKHYSIRRIVYSKNLTIKQSSYRNEIEQSFRYKNTILHINGLLLCLY